MPRNLFIGRSQDWLETKLRSLQEDLANAKTNVSYSAGDVSSSKQVIASIEDTIDKVLYALNLLDPTTYPAASIRRTSVTVGRLSDGSGYI